MNPEQLALASKSFNAMSSISAASAKYSGSMVKNPAGSGVLVRVNQLTVSHLHSAALLVSMSDLEQSTFIYTASPRELIVGGSGSPLAGLIGGQEATPAGVVFRRIFVPNGESESILVRPIYIKPGSAVSVYLGSPNITSYITADWDELPI